MNTFNATRYLMSKKSDGTTYFRICSLEFFNYIIKHHPLEWSIISEDNYDSVISHEDGTIDLNCDFTPNTI